MIGILLLHAVLGLATPACASGIGTVSGQVLTASVQVQIGPLKMNTEDMTATDKKAYIYVMADLFPYRSAIKAAGAGAKPQALARALVEARYAALFPAAPYFRVAMVEFPERDEYDAPRWDKVKVLGRFEVRRKGKGFEARPEKAAKP